MPRKRKRTTANGAEFSQLIKAAEDVKNGSSVRGTAKAYRIDRMTLTRFIKKQDNSGRLLKKDEYGYLATAKAKRILSESMEIELASHIKDLANRFYGLSVVQCRKLAFDFAHLNQVEIPKPWKDNKLAGKEWFLSFRQRQGLSYRAPEPTSLARATAFNQHTVKEFFGNLTDVMERYHFSPNEIYNCDETGVRTVQNPAKIIAEKGKKQIGSITSAERGEMVTLICAINASGNAIPPFFIFPRVRYKEHFINGGPIGSVGRATKSGWVNEDIFLEYLKHFADCTRSSKTKRILLIMDNHESHISLRAVTAARESGIVILTIPPHTSHRLQPLDKTVYGPLKSFYYKAMDNHMRMNPGSLISIYDIPKLISEPFMSAMSQRNITSGFSSTGIYPLNQHIFTDMDFAPAEITNRPDPSTIPLPAIDCSSSPIQSTSETTPSVQLTPLNQGSSEHRYLSPRDILPCPKAKPRKQTNRKRGRTQILATTPKKFCSVLTHAHSRNEVQSSGSESDIEQLPLIQDDSDADFSEEFTDVEDELMIGDYVLVKLGNQHYVGLLDDVDDIQLEARFMKRTGFDIYLDRHLFSFKEGDESAFLKEEVVTKLPSACTIGGTSRRSQQYYFNFCFDDYNIC